MSEQPREFTTEYVAELLTDVVANQWELGRYFEHLFETEPLWVDLALLERIQSARAVQRALDAQIEADVIQARRDGLLWEGLAFYLGTTAEAARQRYGPAAEAAGLPSRVPRRKKNPG